jgi:hypothetical protein
VEDELRRRCSCDDRGRCSRCLLMRAPRSNASPTRRSDTKCSRPRNRWTAAPWAGCAPADSTIFITTAWECPMVPITIDRGCKTIEAACSPCPRGCHVSSVVPQLRRPRRRHRPQSRIAASILSVLLSARPAARIFLAAAVLQVPRILHAKAARFACSHHALLERRTDAPSRQHQPL